MEIPVSHCPIWEVLKFNTSFTRTSQRATLNLPPLTNTIAAPKIMTPLKNSAFLPGVTASYGSAETTKTLRLNKSYFSASRSAPSLTTDLWWLTLTSTHTRSMLRRQANCRRSTLRVCGSSPSTHRAGISPSFRRISIFRIRHMSSREVPERSHITVWKRESPYLIQMTPL